ncbi:MAG: tRNA (N(6)-L-threonylcarbamoyladenosine(37)-C(2))-methylthiotransferase MtaB [Butyribacter sp.]|nr:tRNA (N(6)-L-threonylcarbamoyladenosine(37)-C(2))-methylthiotransferase MtaB [bacterium]MDY3854277.1 tRNA (N(6)-L-threonylcarbamoyladenosine(37)-C(2))-methylthiotransferase MtaB [Butyribacter sp.]
MKVAFLTLGCKVNSYETEKMKMQFEEAGHTVVAFEEEADAYIINTCTVTNIADRKSRKMLHRARRKNPDAIVVATGCYVDSSQKKGEKDESVDLFLSNEQKPQLVEQVVSFFQTRSMKKTTEESTEIIADDARDDVQTTSQARAKKDAHKMMSEKALEEEHTRAYLKVQDGCNQYCTYCIIPYVRGPLTSKTTKEVLEEVKRLAAQGIQEVVVTGIHLSSYGVDFTDKKSFLELEGRPLLNLLQEIAGVEEIKRIRLGSLEPRIITENFAKELSEIPKICPHFHLSLQSGCDNVLKRMNRHYTAADYLERLEILRKYFSNPAITTDIIVGFPQETEEDFQVTCDFVRKAEFSQLHVFKYSRRQGTMADAMEGQIPENVKAERSERLIAVGKEMQQQYQEAFCGQEEKVLFEEIVTIEGQEYLVGYNERYVRFGVAMQDLQDAEKMCNTISGVRILGHITPEIMKAECIR